jgi:excinuclease ABC subunit C
MAAPLEDIVDLLGKVRGNSVREQVAEYCAKFIGQPLGSDANEEPPADM